LTTLTQPVTHTINLRGPEEESVSYNVEKILVKIGVQEIVTTREFRQVKIAIRNAENGATLIPAHAHVKVRGPQRLFEGEPAPAIDAFVDAVGQKTGMATVPVAIVLSPGLELVSQEPVEAILQFADDGKKKPRPAKPTTNRKR
jgi:hypothetical protein